MVIRSDLAGGLVSSDGDPAARLLGVGGVIYSLRLLIADRAAVSGASAAGLLLLVCLGTVFFFFLGK